MKIWYQLISSETAMSDFLGVVRQLCGSVAAQGSEIEVHGTPHGALGDQYRAIWHYDVREFVETALKLRREGGYDAFVVANSLDTGLVELRELLDIPVISFMEVCCFTACTMGERFGVLVQHPKMVTRYREIIHGYGLAGRLASIEFTGHSPGNRMMFPRRGPSARLYSQSHGGWPPRHRCRCGSLVSDGLHGRAAGQPQDLCNRRSTVAPQLRPAGEGGRRRSCHAPGYWALHQLDIITISLPLRN